MGQQGSRVQVARAKSPHQQAGPAAPDRQTARAQGQGLGKLKATSAAVQCVEGWVQPASWHPPGSAHPRWRGGRGQGSVAAGLARSQDQAPEHSWGEGSLESFRAHQKFSSEMQGGWRAALRDTKHGVCSPASCAGPCRAASPGGVGGGVPSPNSGGGARLLRPDLCLAPPGLKRHRGIGPQKRYRGMCLSWLFTTPQNAFLPIGCSSSASC